MGVYGKLKSIAKRAGIKKNVHPHIFRHTKLTEMAKVLTDAELRIFAGWTKSSNMAAVYTHLNSNDVNNKILEKRGLINQEVQQEEKLLEPIKCTNCNNLNPVGNTICEFCNQILDPKTAFSFNNNVLEENKKLQKRINMIENTLKQLAQQTPIKIPFGNHQAMLSVSGLQWNDSFISFNKKEKKEKKENLSF